MRILGIETSCDETGIAIYDGERGLLSNLLYSQADLHASFGGVVPELASRDHVRKTLPMIREALVESNCSPEDLDGIAYTKGPGLVGALLVGSAIAKSLALAWNIPAIGIHHMEGHLVAAMLQDNGPEYPFVALLVSGGHTQLVSTTGLGEYQLLGESLDDAAGEAFDKAAKMLGLGYPGGPEIARLAENGNEHRFRFPRPMTNRPGLDFSFSGLKTYTMNCINQIETLTDQDRADIALAFELAVVDTLTIKCRRALEQTHLNQLVIAGGVSANLRLRTALESMTSHKTLKKEAQIFYPELKFCTDNGAMIAYAGYLRLQQGYKDDLSIQVKPRWPMNTLGSSRKSS